MLKTREGESLEDFSARHKLGPQYARGVWRVARLVALVGVDAAFRADVFASLPRIAPGVAVPTANGPTVMEDE